MRILSKSSVFYFLLASCLLIVTVYACKDNKNSQQKIDETILQGEMNVLVDETVLPIVEDQVAVFESQYKAKIALTAKPETEVINDLINQKTQVAVLTRLLNSQEEAIFKNRKILSRPTIFAHSAIVFLTNKKSNDTLVDLQEVLNLLQQKTSSVESLVFENPNASTLSYMNALAKVDNSAKKGIYALNSHEDVLKYVIKNTNSIGVVGLNLIVQPNAKLQPYLSQLKVMAVRNVKSSKNNQNYYKPSQSNLGAGLYPLIQPLYLLNYQGKTGLGMGFGSFIAGEIGQRIVLKSGLLPENIPTRIISIRKELEKK